MDKNYYDLLKAWQNDNDERYGRSRAELYRSKAEIRQRPESPRKHDGESAEIPGKRNSLRDTVIDAGKRVLLIITPAILLPMGAAKLGKASQAPVIASPEQESAYVITAEEQSELNNRLEKLRTELRQDPHLRKLMLQELQREKSGGLER